jgi:hypothetical protein
VSDGDLASHLRRRKSPQNRGVNVTTASNNIDVVRLYPVEKRAGVVTASNAGEASNALFRGAVAQTGEALALAVNTGRATVFGAAASALAQAQPPSPFQRDLREFGLVIARLTLALVVIVLETRVLLGRPVLDSLLFAVALAVGLTPELLPMITTVTLSRGAMRMAGRKVIGEEGKRDKARQPSQSESSRLPRTGNPGQGGRRIRPDRAAGNPRNPGGRDHKLRLNRRRAQ